MMGKRAWGLLLLALAGILLASAHPIAASPLGARPGESLRREDRRPAVIQALAPVEAERDVKTGKEPVVRISTASGRPGDTVALAVSLENNPGIITLSFDLAYDPALEIVALDPRDDDGTLLFRDSGACMEWLTQTTPASLAKNPKRISFGADLARKNLTYSGPILRVDFRIKEGAPVGKVCPVTLSTIGTRKMAYDVALKPVDFAVENGEIRVADCLHETVNKTPDLPAACTAAGYRGESVCAQCGRVLEQRRPIPAAGHDLLHLPFTPPTHELSGFREHYRCQRCGLLFRDAEGHEEMPESDALLAPISGRLSLTGKTSGATGERVQATLFLEEISFPEGYEVCLLYEDAALTLEGCMPSSSIAAADVRCDIGGDGKGRVYLTGRPADPDAIGSAPLAEFTFRIRDSAPTGDSTLRVWLRPVDEAPAGQFRPEYACNLTLRIQKVKIGDVNGDGSVTAADRNLIAKTVAGWNTVGKIDTFAADVDRDGKLSAKDRTIVARYIANWNGYDLESCGAR